MRNILVKYISIGSTTYAHIGITLGFKAVYNCWHNANIINISNIWTFMSYIVTLSMLLHIVCTYNNGRITMQNMTTIVSSIKDMRIKIPTYLFISELILIW